MPQVLYLDVEEGDGLERLLAAAEAVRGHFSECGLLQVGQLGGGGRGSLPGWGMG